MKKTVILIAILGFGAVGAYYLSGKREAAKAAETAVPIWIEADSTEAIERRIASDFSLTRQDILEAIQLAHPEVTDADIDRFLANRYIEAKTIDGELRYFKKSPRNIGLLNPEYNGGVKLRGAAASEKRISYVDSVLKYYKGKNKQGLSHEVTYRFSVDVPGDPALAGDTLRVWMPVPFDSTHCQRQRSVEILSAEPADYILSQGRSAHNTIYFTLPAPAPGDTAHFEYVGRFVTSGAHFAPEAIESAMKPYDTESALYKENTAFDNRHIVRLDSLAAAIVGDEKNPLRQSELVYDYIIARYPWAGAREYSTIECIPQYVIDEGHGDCGQVSLLYISLMRTLGVPARWESGWMLHPGEINLHDWAEVYFEGIGWVPVDVSFGRYTSAGDDEIEHFYSHGIDSHRFATNKSIGMPLYPAKKYVRSETVDFQLGEVECGRGNLFYPAWNSNLELISNHPVNENDK